MNQDDLYAFELSRVDVIVHILDLTIYAFG